LCLLDSMPEWLTRSWIGPWGKRTRPDPSRCDGAAFLVRREGIAGLAGHACLDGAPQNRSVAAVDGAAIETQCRTSAFVELDNALAADSHGRLVVAQCSFRIAHPLPDVRPRVISMRTRRLQLERTFDVGQAFLRPT